MHFVCFTAVTKYILVRHIYIWQQHRIKTMSVLPTHKAQSIPFGFHYQRSSTVGLSHLGELVDGRPEKWPQRSKLALAQCSVSGCFRY